MTFIPIPSNARTGSYKYDNLNINLIFSYKSIDLNPSIGLRTKENSNDNFYWGVEFIDLTRQTLEVLFNNKDDRNKFLESLNQKLS